MDNDFYPDFWEDNDPEAKKYGFSSNDPRDDYANTGDSGERYEEDLCRQVEHNLNETLYDSKDWSYDPTNLNQGKQWK